MEKHKKLLESNNCSSKDCENRSKDLTPLDRATKKVKNMIIQSSEINIQMNYK